MKRSDIASFWRGKDCTLNGRKATISGWGNDFATIASLDGELSFEWSWASVNRIMSNGRDFIANNANNLKK